MTTAIRETPTGSASAGGGAVAPVLQGILVDLLEARLQAKQFHWTVKGPFFRPVHLQLDETAGALDGWADEVAERMAALRAVPDGRAATVTATTRVEPWPEGDSPDGEGVAAFASRLDALAGRLRDAMAALEPADAVSHDLVLGIAEGVEKQRWMFESQAR